MIRRIFIAVCLIYAICGSVAAQRTNHKDPATGVHYAALENAATPQAALALCLQHVQDQGGGTCDATGITAPFTIASTISTSGANPVRLMLGSTAITTAFTGAAKCAFTVSSDNFTLEGQGAASQIALGRSDDTLICVGDGITERKNITIKKIKLVGLSLPCCVDNQEIGIQLKQVTGFSIDNVDFENLSAGFAAYTSRDGTISNLRFRGTTYGSLRVSQQSVGDYGRIAISNIVSTDQQAGSMGLRLTGFGAVVGGKFTANGLVFQGIGSTTAEGIVLETAEHIVIDGAVISNMGIGVGLQAGSRYNTISNVDVYGPATGTPSCLDVGEGNTIATDNQFSHIRCRATVPGVMACVQNMPCTTAGCLEGNNRNKYTDITCSRTAGFAVTESSDITLEGGLLDELITPAGHGAIRLFANSGVPMVRNKIRGVTIRKPSSIGIQPVRVAFSDFSGNTISDCSQGGGTYNGIQDDADALHNSYIGNTVLNSPARTITDATNTSPIIISVSNHGFATGDAGTIAAVTGNTAANGDWLFTVINKNTFSLDGSTGNGAYTGAGTAKYRYGCNSGIALFGPYNTIGGNDLTTTNGLYVDASSTGNKYVVTTDSNYVVIADAALGASQLLISQGGQHAIGLGTLGTTTTVLHGNAAGLPSFGAVQAADLAITVAIPDAALGINQLLLGQNTNHLTGLGDLGTTTKVLHGNAAGPPSFAVIVDADLPSSMADKTLTGNVVLGSGGTAITKHLSFTTGWDPPSMADGASQAVTITVTGAITGDTCVATHDQIGVTAVMVSCVIGDASTAKVVLLNRTGGVYDIGNGTIRVDVWKH